MAAWKLSPADLRAVVGTVKRSPSYRAICRTLRSRCPRDVWIDGRTGFVHFDGGGDDSAPAWFIFAVSLDSHEVVAARRLEPAAGGEIRVADVRPSRSPG